METPAAAQPPRALLRDRDGKILRILSADDDPEIDALGLRPPAFVTVEAADGTTLHGALYLGFSEGTLLPLAWLLFALAWLETAHRPLPVRGAVLVLRRCSESYPTV